MLKQPFDFDTPVDWPQGVTFLINKCINYKPGYKISAEYESSQDMVIIRASGFVPNVYEDNYIEATSSQKVHRGILRTVDDVLRFTLDAIRELEFHEMSEWFEVSGLEIDGERIERPFDPHRK